MSDSDTNTSQDLLGKKIFFLYPTASLKNQVLSELAQQEYEVYVAKDHTRLSQALKKYPDSIIFVNIDEGMKEQEWERWIGGVLTGNPGVKIGVFSSNSDEELKEKYINRLHVSCGFLTLKLDMSKSVDTILGILKTTDAKGRRKYIRATTESETTAKINMPFNGEFISGIIKDISVVGFSCVFEKEAELRKNTLFKDIQIRLQSMLLKVEAIAFGSRMDGSQKSYVLIFTQRIDPDVRIKIRKYIQMNLQNKMDSEIN